MRHSAIYFATEVSKRARAGEHWDAIVCTDMMNAAEFRGLTPMVNEVPLILYFHENQFAYPDRFHQERDQHFAFTNFVSSVTADQIWFNSAFNRDSMLEALSDQAKRWPDFVPHEAMDQVTSKSTVEHPGVEIPPLDWQSIEQARRERVASGQPLHLIWAARWEHDKNPAGLLAALRKLNDLGVPFKLSVVGQQYRNVPAEFETIQTEFADSIERWGYQPDRATYWRALCDADVFVSTATHEFFGLAAAEAIAAGVYPLLPNRLAYPELLSVAGGSATDSCLYGETHDDLTAAVIKLHRDRGHFASLATGIKFREQLAWSHRAKKMDSLLLKLGPL
jgi:glycosyltransferase involved in cell wall biosynthesis